MAWGRSLFYVDESIKQKRKRELAGSAEKKSRFTMVVNGLVLASLTETFYVVLCADVVFNTR